MRRWHAGNMIIIGDAAHATAPSSGQGASMALEDAAILPLIFRRAAKDGGRSMIWLQGHHVDFGQPIQPVPAPHLRQTPPRPGSPDTAVS